jgi:hypothetical protein
MTAEFLLGFTAFGCLVIALFFARFWRGTGDRFFALFSLAFAIFGVNRIVLGFLDEDHEARPAIYVIRFLAFAIIVVAIIDRDRRPEAEG